MDTQIRCAFRILRFLRKEKWHVWLLLKEEKELQKVLNREHEDFF